MLVQAVVTLAFALQCAALKFAVQAGDHNVQPYCLREFVAKDTLVSVSVRVSPDQTGNQQLGIEIKDTKGNQYARRDSIADTYTQIFTPSHDATVDICFRNVWRQASGHGEREVQLDVDIGARARDWNQLKIQESLKPVEVDLKRADEVIEEVQKELEYLLRREARLRDTNESTNRRVQNFFVLSVLAFLGLGGWQIYYLRSYFRSKHII